MSSIREGLGYNLKYYNPCFNYNADRFCCSDRGAQFRKNILLSDCQLTKSSDYSRPRNNDPSDPTELRPDFATTGITDPRPYTFTPQDRSYIWCSRLPCSVNPDNSVPCQKKQPIYHNPGNCGKDKCGN